MFKETSHYVSCIKIDGQPILPPLMTPERCAEMLKYKALAVEIENRRKLKKEEIIETPKLEIESALETCVNVTVALESEQDQQTPTIDKLNQLLDDTIISENSNLVTAPKPTLIRQNSYIIETPSPLLLAYLENNKNEAELNQNDSSDKKRRSCWDLTSAKEKWSSFENNLDFVFIPTKINPKNVKSKITKSVPHSPSPSPSKELEIKLPSKKTKYFKRHSFSAGGASRTITPEFVKPKPVYPEEPKTCSDLSSVNDFNARDIYLAIQNEHSKQMAELMIRQKKEQEILLRRLKDQQMLFNEQIKQNYVDAMVQNNLLDQNSFESRTESALGLSKTSISVQTDPAVSSQEKCFQTDSIEILPNFETSTQISDLEIETMQIPLSDDITIINSEPYETDLESDCPSKDDTIEHSQSKSVKQNNNINIRNSMPIILLNKLQSFKCSRELFPELEISKQELEPSKIEKAAVTIQAYTRGYLVRRLLRTDRVKNLIQTLKDTLLCALDFHKESTDNIEQVDVDLHRRLIQQLTAACYAIHDTFFQLSIKEQMTIINLDRIRQKEKLLRPQSAKSLSLLSSTTVKTIRRKQESPRGLTVSTISNGSDRITTKKSESLNFPAANRLTSSLITTSTTPINTNTFKIRRCFSQTTNKQPWR